MFFEKYSKSLIASLLAVQLLVAYAQSTTETIDSRIVGGYAVQISNAPYIVKVRYNNQFICGGTLVTSLFVVSAAHCVEGVLPSELLVIGGATYLSEAGVARKIVAIRTPANYNPTTYNHDVAVLKLAAQMTGTNISPIGLFTGDLRPGMSVKVTGWGANQEGGGVSNSLMTVFVPVISRTECQKKYPNENITLQMFCASQPGVKDSCQGDSGGPVVYNGKLCGIVSWGYGCARYEYPGVYTNITTVRTFITNSMY